MSYFSTRKGSNWAGYFFIIYYLVGLLGLTMPGTRDTFISLMPLSILLSTAILFLFHKKWRAVDGVILLFIAITGYLVEVLGVLTGHVFGSYSYGDTLGIQAFNTPLIIGLNWMMLAYCAFSILEPARLFWPLKALLAALLMVVYDVVMEPVAMRLDMWNWAEGVVPMQNYQAWFIISLIFLGAMHLAKIKTYNRVAGWLFGVQFFFFLLLNISTRIF